MFGEYRDIIFTILQCCKVKIAEIFSLWKTLGAESRLEFKKLKFHIFRCLWIRGQKQPRISRFLRQKHPHKSNEDLKSALIPVRPEYNALDDIFLWKKI